MSLDCTRLTEENIIELVVVGHIRILENTKNATLKIPSIPRPIVVLMIQFFPRNKWKFIDQDRYKKDEVIMTEEGKSVKITKGKYVSVQFGEFIDCSSDMIYSFRFKMGYTPQCGIGFCTKEYSNWSHGGLMWNDGGNGSMVLYGNGYNPWSQSLLNPADHDKSLRKYTKKYWIKNQGDEVIVKIDAKTMRVVMWNETQLKVGDMKMDGIDPKHKAFAFMCQFPMDAEIAVMIEMGNTPQTVSILQQQFIHRKSDGDHAKKDTVTALT